MKSKGLQISVSLLLIVILILGTSCKTSDNSGDVSGQPYREYGKYKYDEELGGTYQLVDYIIDDKPGDNVARIELIFVTNYERVTNSGEFIIPWGSFWIDNEGSDDVLDDGVWKDCTALGSDIVDGSRMYYSYFKIQDSFRKKLETGVNHRNLFGEEFLTVFRIDEYRDEKYGIDEIFVYHGLDTLVIPGSITEKPNPDFTQDFIDNRIIMTYTKR